MEAEPPGRGCAGGNATPGSPREAEARGRRSGGAAAARPTGGRRPPRGSGRKVGEEGDWGSARHGCVRGCGRELGGRRWGGVSGRQYRCRRGGVVDPAARTCVRTRVRAGASPGPPARPHSGGARGGRAAGAVAGEPRPGTEALRALLQQSRPLGQHQMICRGDTRPRYARGSAQRAETRKV